MGVMRRWWQVAAVAALLASAGVAAGMVQLPLSRVAGGEAEPFQREEMPVESAPAADAGSGNVSVPDWLVWAFMVIAGAAILIAVLAALRGVLSAGPRFRRRAVPRRKATASPAVSEAEVIAAVDAGLHDLDDADTDPRKAVIACWVRLESAAMAAGTPRRPGDTSTDLVLRLLTEHELSRDVLSEFAEVYRSARYASRHEVDVSTRSRARAALTHLRGQLLGVPT